jgi:hypothetical protein
LFNKHWPDLERVLDNPPAVTINKPASPSGEALIPELFELVRVQSDEPRRLVGSVADIAAKLEGFDFPSRAAYKTSSSQAEWA